MAKYLKQSTASQEIPIGYMVDSTDGNTEEIALTIANTDIKLWKNGATTLANKNSGGGTHISNGIYYAVLDATDTDTLGPLKVFVHVAGALPFEDSYAVVTASQWDEIHSGTETAKIARATYLVDTDIATLASQTSFTLTAGSADDDAYNGQAFLFTDVSTAVQKGIAFGSDYTGSTKTVTLEAAPGFTIATTDLVTIVPAGGSTSAPAAVNVTQWNGSAVATPTTAGVPEVDVTHWLGTAAATPTVGGVPEVDITHVGGAALNTSSAQIGVNVVNVGGSAEAITTNLDATVSSRSTQTSVDTIDDFLDTEVAAILALLDDPRGEPGQGAPPVNPDLATKVDYLYKAWRNKSTQTSSQYSLYADDTTTVDQKATVSSDGTTLTRGEVATGP